MARKRSKAKRTQVHSRTRATYSPLTPRKLRDELSRRGRSAGSTQVRRLVVSPTYRSPQAVSFNNTVLLTGSSPAHSQQRNAIRSPAKPLFTSFERARSLFKAPKFHTTCVRRAQRKQVLMAKFGGRGPSPSQQKRRQMKADSEIKC